MKQRIIVIVLWYLRNLARVALWIHKPFIIGVAGSVGKSSTRNALSAAFEYTGQAISVYGNSETGLPLGLLGIHPKGYTLFAWLKMLLQAPFGILHLRGAKYLIVEMGIDGPDSPNNMEYLLRFVKPDIAVSLNVGATHTMQFETVLRDNERSLPEEQRRDILLDAIAVEDTKIIRQSGCRVGIYNAADQFVARQIDLFAQTKHHTTLWSFEEVDTGSTNAWLAAYNATSDGTTFDICIRTAGQQNNNVGDMNVVAAQTNATQTTQSIQIHFPALMLPQVYWENIAVTLLCIAAAGLNIQKAAESLQKRYELPKSRASLLRGIHDSLIIDSSYNASRIAIVPFLELMSTVAKKENRETIFLFGDMRELGDESHVEHTALLPLIRTTCDRVYCVGPLTKRFIMPELKKDAGRAQHIEWFESSEELGRALATNMPSRAVVLVKGSQNEIFLEEAIKPLLENHNDQALLTRQEPYWLVIKRKFFMSL